MSVIEVEGPSEYVLNLLREESGRDWEWVLHEYIPYVEGPIAKRYEVSEPFEAFELIEDITFEPQVASFISYVRVEGCIDDELLEAFDVEGVIVEN